MRKLQYTIATFFVLLIPTLSLGIIQHLLLHATFITYVALVFLQLIVYSAIISFLYYRTKKFYGQAPHFNWSKLPAEAGHALLWLIAYLLLFILFDAFDNFQWVQSAGNYLIDSEILLKRKFYHELLNIFTGALAEEMIFRYFLLGIWMHHIRSSWQSGVIIIIVNLVFALFHFNNYSLLDTLLIFFIGIFYTMVWMGSGSILTAAGVHFIHNLIVTGDRQIVAETSKFDLSDYFINYGFYFALTALLLIYAIRKKKVNHFEQLYLNY